MTQNGRAAEQLGMSYGGAYNRLRKLVLFDLLRRLGENYCYRCGDEILDASALTLEHKEAWENKDVALFWDMDNIAFSHAKCNVRGKKQIVHGTRWAYEGPERCRCPECREAHRAYQVSWRKKTRTGS